MTVLADFTVLNKLSIDQTQDGTFENPYIIGDASNGRFTHSFNTGGLHHSTGLLTLMVRGLTDDSARVAIMRKDGVEINLGRLQESSVTDKDMWRQQQFLIPTNVLSPDNGEANTLVIGRVETTQSGAGQFDDFEVRDIVVFFHQAT